MAFPHFTHYETPLGYMLQREHGNPNYHNDCYKATENHRNAMGVLIEKGVWVLDDCYTQICPEQDTVWHYPPETLDDWYEKMRQLSHD